MVQGEFVTASVFTNSELIKIRVTNIVKHINIVKNSNIGKRDYSDVGFYIGTRLTQ